MSLLDISTNIFVNKIKLLPPLLKEKLFGISIDKIREEIREEVVDKLKKDLLIVSEGFLIDYIKSKTRGSSSKKYKALNSIYDKDIVDIAEDITENFINNYEQCYISGSQKRKRKCDYSDDSDDQNCTWQEDESYDEENSPLYY